MDVSAGSKAGQTHFKRTGMRAGDLEEVVLLGYHAPARQAVGEVFVSLPPLGPLLDGHDLQAVPYRGVDLDGIT